MRSPLLEREGHRRIGLDRADTVDARHRRDDHHVVAFEQRARRRMAHAVDLLVDRGFLLDIGVGARHIGFGLVVVVIRDEIFHRIVGKEAPELAIELRRERLVRREDQRRALRRLDHLRHREGLARARDAEQHLVAVVALHALDQLAIAVRLVALRLEVRLDDEPLAAFGLLRPRRAMRRPGDRAFEFGAALAQQRVQRLARSRRRPSTGCRRAPSGAARASAARTAAPGTRPRRRRARARAQARARPRSVRRRSVLRLRGFGEARLTR